MHSMPVQTQSHSMFQGFHDTQVLAAFQHSPEYIALLLEGVEPRFVPPLLEHAEALWLEPDDITGSILIELIHEMPHLSAYQLREIPAVVQELFAFWSFARRECGYPFALDCLHAIKRDAARALECALAH